MPNYRFQVAIRSLAPLDQAADNIVNTFYLSDPDLPGTGDPTGLATDAAALWATYRGYPAEIADVNVRAYDMSHALPREPLADVTADIVAGGTVGKCREIALCLSYFADRNIPRQRGRMYLGPWTNAAGDIRPSGTLITNAVDLANGIAGLGGVEVDWVQYSPTTNTFRAVTDFWVDDEWDVIRSRGLQPTTRTTGTVGE